MASEAKKELKEIKKFWSSLADITAGSQLTTIYLLKTLGFNSQSSFRAIKEGLLSVNEIIKDFELFVNNLPANSPHFKSLNINPAESAQFFFKSGQKACIAATIAAIIAKLFPQTPQTTTTTTSSNANSTPSRSSNSSSFSTSTSSNDYEPPRKRQRQQSNSADPSLNLLQLQQFVNQHLSKVSRSHGIDIDHFQIMSSDTESFPYKLSIECPICFKTIKTMITVDVKKSGGKYLNYRRTEFTKHFLSCVNADEETEEEDDQEKNEEEEQDENIE